MQRRSSSVKVRRPDCGVGIAVGAPGADNGVGMVSTGVLSGRIGLGVWAGADKLDKGWDEGGLREGLVSRLGHCGTVINGYNGGVEVCEVAAGRE